MFRQGVLKIVRIDCFLRKLFIEEILARMVLASERSDAISKRAGNASARFQLARDPPAATHKKQAHLSACAVSNTNPAAGKFFIHLFISHTHWMRPSGGDAV